MMPVTIQPQGASVTRKPRTLSFRLSRTVYWLTIGYHWDPSSLEANFFQNFG